MCHCNVIYLPTYCTICIPGEKINTKPGKEARNEVAESTNEIYWVLPGWTSDRAQLLATRGRYCRDRINQNDMASFQKKISGIVTTKVQGTWFWAKIYVNIYEVNICVRVEGGNPYPPLSVVSSFLSQLSYQWIDNMSLCSKFLRTKHHM